MQSSITTPLKVTSGLKTEKMSKKIQRINNKLANTLKKLNPKNWFADFANLSITLEEFTPKKKNNEEL